jgi:hypothetical protein
MHPNPLRPSSRLARELGAAAAFLAIIAVVTLIVLAMVAIVAVSAEALFYGPAGALSRAWADRGGDLRFLAAIYFVSAAALFLWAAGERVVAVLWKRPRTMTESESGVAMMVVCAILAALALAWML